MDMPLRGRGGRLDRLTWTWIGRTDRERPNRDHGAAMWCKHRRGE